MSLVLWLPLNGNIENQGLTGYIPQSVGTVAYSTSGKTGKAYIRATTSASSTNGISIPNNMCEDLGTEYSISVWIKPYGTHTHYNGTVFSSGNWNETASYAFGVSQDNSKVDAFGPRYNTYVNCPVPVGEWTHIVSTHKNKVGSVYKNGEYIGKYDFTGDTLSSTASNVTIGRETYASGYFGFNGEICDVRVYNHCLSEKEIRELSKALILHYKLDTEPINGKVYDSSGFNNNGTVGNTLTVDNDSSRFSKSTVFASSAYINAYRGAMVTDSITVSCWAYMESWGNYNARLLSCTESGGWNFEPLSGKMNFAMGTGVSSNTYKSANSTKTLASLESGWHLFTGTYDGLTTKIYIDGELDGTNNAYTTKTPIRYHGSNVVFIGAEAGSSASSPAGNYFTGKMADVRIYGTALSAEDIKELYNLGASIDRDGNVFTYEIKEI